LVVVIGGGVMLAAVLTGSAFARDIANTASKVGIRSVDCRHRSIRRIRALALHGSGHRQPLTDSNLLAMGWTRATQSPSATSSQPIQQPDIRSKLEDGLAE
jgi:hypothetical protein